MGKLIRFPQERCSKDDQIGGATIIRWPRHRLVRCRDPECSGCMFCEGGLASCEVCRGGEGTLPTDCPGYALPWDIQQAVWQRRIDYRHRRGGWVCLPSEEPMSGYYP